MFCRCLVSKLFDVCPRSTLEEIVLHEEVRVAWGTGIAGHVAESGEPVNIPDAYQVCTFFVTINSLHFGRLMHFVLSCRMNVSIVI